MKKLLTLLLCLTMTLTMMPGMVFAADEDAGTTETNYAAEVTSGETKASYATLQEAIDEATTSGETIKLLKDCRENVTIDTGKNITLDLNGYTLNGGTERSQPALTNKGTVVIKDSSEAKTGTIKREDTPSTTAYYTVMNDGTMTIESGNIENNSGLMPPDWGGSSLICNGYYQTATLNITGGKISQDNFIAVKNEEHGTLTISDNAVIESKTQAVQNWKDATISGGTLTGDVTTWTYNNTSATTAINGGIITGEIQAIQLTYKNVKPTNKPAVNISGNANITGRLTVGEQSDMNGTTYKEDSTAGSVSIAGGSFSASFGATIKAEYLAEGSDAYKKADGSYVVAGATAEGGVPPIEPAPGYHWEEIDGIFTEVEDPYIPPYIPPTPTTQKPTVEADANVTVTLSDYGTIATITVADGYELVDVTVNGISKGKVTTVAGLKTGDKLVVTTQKIVTPEEEEAAKNARLKAGVENTTIKLTSTLGKGFIKLNWKKSAGYKVDYYEVYKSTKRYSGYGTEPYFKTKQGGMTGWYKNTKELKKGTRYYYKVRGVREIAGETVYTQYSNKAWRLIK